MSMDRADLQEAVMAALRTVRDPELGADLATLEMVKQVAVCEGHVRIDIELTTPACPLKATLQKDIEQAVSGIDGIDRVAVEFTARVRGASTPTDILPDVRNIVAVGAGKGGVGKSTVSTLLAVGLARAGAKVGLMDADVYGPSIPKMLGIESTHPELDGERIVPVEVVGLKVISIGLMIPPGEAVIWRGPMIHNAIRQFFERVAWGELDYLIVDLPPGTGDVPLTITQTIPITGAVVVCTPQQVALADALRAARMYEKLKVPVLGMIENMSYFIAPDTGVEYDLFGKGGVERASHESGIPFLGSIPVNVGIRVSGDAGTPESIFQENPEGVCEAVTSVVEHVAARISVHQRGQSAQAAEPARERGQ